MPAASEALKAERIEKVAALAGKRTKAGQAIEDFVARFYADVPPDDLCAIESDDLYGGAIGFWQFCQERRPGTPKVRVFNPDFDEHGWRSTHTVVEIVNDDMPFLVDSVTGELNRRGLAVHLVIHPILPVVRDAEGRLREIGAPGATDGHLRESLMHIEIDEQAGGEVHEELRGSIAKVLEDVRLAVEDWKPMLGKIDEVLGELESDPPPGLPAKEIETGIAFLRWLRDDHFTLLGYREYETVGTGAEAHMGVAKGSGLGLLRDDELHVFEGVHRLAELPAEVREYLERKRLLIINKANMRSTVHRAVHMDAIGIKRFGADGRVAHERLFVGLFTSTVYTRSPRNIPLLADKIDRIVERSGFEPSSHNGKALQHILETYPRDELFQASEDELHDICRGILHLQERQRIALFVRQDAFQRFVSCLVFVPRERYNTQLRQRFQQILERAYDGPVTSFSTQISDDSLLGRIQFGIKTTPGAVPEVDVAQLEARLVEAGRSWSDDLRDALVEEYGEERGLSFFRRYGNAFPVAYTEQFAAPAALADIRRIEAVLDGAHLELNLYRSLEGERGEVRFKLYKQGRSVPLSGAMPLLEEMGFRVEAEVPYEVQLADGPPVWVQDFAMTHRIGQREPPPGIRESFREAFLAVWDGAMENDGFNELVVTANLDWRRVVILRAYAKYLRQTGAAFSQDYIEEALNQNPEIARLLVELFEARFDPAQADDRGEREAALRAQIEDGLNAVESLDQDRIVRRMTNLIEATLRTNVWQRTADGEPKPYVAVKFDSRAIDQLPAPRPYREIFVYSPRVEGVHLRGGPVARGGLRWSDRREDFRTEVLGLVKAQQVKNAVIVPVGSKGGFVVKTAPPATGDAQADREARQQEGIACYKTFISGLLDLTDNLKGGDVVPPPDVVRHDEDDPYLVVAADKGTATFSDIANEVAEEYGFWLGDAFASGGSAGYDHKKMGITARGAWEAVKRHFRELGTDIQSEPFTVVGCGDMSGDVFGNGMLLSERIKLVGAFNHQHIFVDPDPDPAASFAERKRLFELPRSSWEDYDKRLISKGGGVFERRAKSISLTPEIKALFEISEDKVTPAELIRAMLCAQADLLWFGGIGTYIKAPEESDADTGDRTNDALRVDADHVRARVVGEGANLGITQRGRIALATRGCRLNTDAIDNSAGVDCSDHEVNIKIALADLVETGDMTRKQRDKLLVDMTDDVAALVLRDNYQQTQAISLVERMGVDMLEPQARLIRDLERAGRLDRALELLPDEEQLAERKAEDRGLTRPELSVLLAYAKIALKDALLASKLPDDPMLAADLRRYFPNALVERCGDRLDRHRLRREIIATHTTNSLINRVGPAFMYTIREETGQDDAAIARAYIVSRDAFELRSLWAEVEALDNQVPADLQLDLQLETRMLIERATIWFLRNTSQPLDVAGTVGAYRPAISTLSGNLSDLLDERERGRLAHRAEGYVERGAPKALAARLAALPMAVPLLDIVRLASDSDASAADVGRVYFTLGERFSLDWLREAAEAIEAGDYWEDLALRAMVDDLYSHQYELTDRILETAGGQVAGAEAVIDTWMGARAAAVERTARMIDEMQSTGAADLAKLAVASRQIRALLTAGR